MKKAFILHGTFGNPEENWFPWLKDELIRNEYQVFVPAFPTPENQSLNTWLEVINKYVNKMDENTILIGHSMGSTFIFNILQTYKIKVNNLYLAAAFDRSLDHPIDELAKTFLEEGFDWSRIQSRFNKCYMFSGDNDKYISIDIPVDIAKNLNADLEIIKGGGHLNATSGYTKFELLLSKIIATESL